VSLYGTNMAEFQKDHLFEKIIFVGIHLKKFQLDKSSKKIIFYTALSSLLNLRQLQKFPGVLKNKSFTACDRTVK
jgi:hypothetical protein